MVMPIQQICPQCHNTTFHFDRARHAIVCDICGSGINEGDNANAELEYDRNRQKAIAYIRSGYYGNAMQYLENMRSTVPDDPDIYYLHLMGITSCCHNMLETADIKTLQTANEYWEKLSTLGGDKTLFLQYMNTRKDFGIQKHESILRRSFIWATVFLTALIIFGLLSLTTSYWFILGIIGCAVPFFCMHIPQQIWNTLKRIREIESSEHPFFKI